MQQKIINFTDNTNKEMYRLALVLLSVEDSLRSYEDHVTSYELDTSSVMASFPPNTHVLLIALSDDKLPDWVLLELRRLYREDIVIKFLDGLRIIVPYVELTMNLNLLTGIRYSVAIAQRRPSTAKALVMYNGKPVLSGRLDKLLGTNLKDYLGL